LRERKGEAGKKTRGGYQIADHKRGYTLLEYEKEMAAQFEWDKG